MNTYIAFYRQRKIQVTALTSYEAQSKAAAQFKAKKSYDVSVMLVALGDREITHSTCELP